MRLHCHFEPEAKNPGGLGGSPGFGFVQPLLFFSGRPIGEPRLNNRYYDYDANYDAAKKQAAKTQIHRPTGGRRIERELEMTIGHKLSGY
ncbi:MAG: hypothetical protein AB7P14_08870 [Blastocatellales bacterium]